MKKITETFKAHKYAIIWTVCYTAVIWAILNFLFNFDMFSLAYWRHLMRAELRGFPGFVFGILILAALPLYVATTTLIVRTKKPLITVPVPSPIKKVWTKMQPTLIEKPTPEQTQEEKKSEEKNDTCVPPLPEELPSELRTAYIRTRMNITPEQRSAFNQPIQQTQNTPTPTVEIPESEISEIPLPTDFDIDPTDNNDFEMPDFTQMSAPTFSEITFDDTPTENPKQKNPISEHLNTIGKQFEIIDDIIITDKQAIATHTDDDFWVCDEDFWFATGKQIDSPVKQAITIASERGLTPILYLGADNIMEIDTMCKKWESMGIKIIKSPDEIPE